MKILVAEDEPELLRFYKVLLEDLGNEVVTVRDGKECWDAYLDGFGSNSESSFDLVILDHRMPRMNVMEVANEIAKINRLQKQLMITAFEGVLDQTQKPANMEIIAKPFDLDELVIKIKNLAGGLRGDRK